MSSRKASDARMGAGGDSERNFLDAEYKLARQCEDDGGSEVDKEISRTLSC